jgi:hypothetical protein
MYIHTYIWVFGGIMLFVDKAYSATARKLVHYKDRGKTTGLYVMLALLQDSNPEDSREVTANEG